MTEAPETKAPFAGELRTSRGTNFGDRMFMSMTTVVAAGAVAILVMIALLLFSDASVSLGHFGFGFLTSSKWDPGFQEFGALAYIYGTIVTSLVALLLATPVALGAAIFVAEYAPPWLR